MLLDHIREVEVVVPVVRTMLTAEYPKDGARVAELQCGIGEPNDGVFIGSNAAERLQNFV
jgi:hypothetical protein